MRESRYVLFGSLLVVSVGACGGSEKKPLGAPCDAKTVCEGVCLLDLPGGMCATSCEETGTCEKGVCVTVSGGRYCVPDCTQDSDCRQEDGFLCIDGACRQPQKAGSPCSRPEDCQSQFRCVQGYCGVPCLDDSGCYDGFFCGEDNGQRACIPLDCRSGTCNKPCSGHVDCPSGTYCGEQGVCVVDSCDDQGVCAHPCESHDDCPDGTYCAWVEGSYHCVFLPEGGGPGTTGEPCAASECAEGYICVSRGEEDPNAYCTTTCDSDWDCPPDMACREDVLEAGGQPTKYCIKRAFCEPCLDDLQCRYPQEKCVAADPAVGEGAYCSTACAPNMSDTCPTDSTCKQAYWCESAHAWVADCAWCDSGCDTSQSVYQCFKDYGACVGDGSLCAPCHHAGQCSSEGTCLTFSSNGVRFCSAPCDANGLCPEGYWCVNLEGFGNQCVPRRASCTEPSGSGTMCVACQDFRDCVSGTCYRFGGSSVCLPSCVPGGNDCDGYSECRRVTDDYGIEWDVCVPTLLDDCGEWRDCHDHCPTGPDSCDASAPNYCT